MSCCQNRAVGHLGVKWQRRLSRHRGRVELCLKRTASRAQRLHLGCLSLQAVDPVRQRLRAHRRPGCWIRCGITAAMIAFLLAVQSTGIWICHGPRQEEGIVSLLLSKLMSEVSVSASRSSVVWNGPGTVIDVISNSISNAANGSARQVHRPRGTDSY